MRNVLKKIPLKVKLAILISLVLLLVVAVVMMDSRNRTVTTFFGKSDEETAVIQILKNMDGVGNADVLIRQDEDAVTGVVVVCEGANDIMVRSDILNAVSTALHIPKNVIVIYKMTK